jgi:type VI secretion system protein ImpI
MTLRLAIENMDRLPDGGPLRVEVKGRGLDIGRDAHLDWTLPDPSRYVSGKHCEIRFRDNEYWLYDVSTNGTFVNGAPYRLDAPYRLRDQDRLSIGPYIIAVSIEGAPAAAAAPAAASAPGADVWGASGEVAPPDDRAAYRVRQGPATPGDFLDFATDAGMAPGAPPAAPWTAPPAPPPSWPATPAPSADDAWLTAPPPPVAPPPPPVELPRPTRPAEPPVPRPAEPAPLRPAEPAPPPPPAAPSDAALIERIAQAAGIPPAAVTGRDAGELADEIGAVLRLTALNLMQMAASRRQTKSAIRSAHHTMFQPTENNPIKFAADPEHAMEMMFGPPSRIHLKASTAVAQVFDELKAHSVLTFGAMQGALDALFEDLSPDRIEAVTPQERGLSAMVASRKARLWDTYAERWKALTKRADGRLNDAFMGLFAQAYDRLNDKSG